ncbi:glycosyl transferase family 1 [Sulfolobus acidocaldarius SUSAZ]|nr:glycosyl transferase family 1 [Sulfolobus acidocaldarius SUSAZ]
MKSTLVIHRITRSVSGEGYVVRVSAELLREKNVETRIATFSPPLEDLGFPYVSVIPFKMRRFDKYQRVFTVFSAKKTNPDFFLNITAIPLPLSRIAPHIIYGVAPEFSSVPSKYNSSFIWRLYLVPMRGILKQFKEEAKRAIFIANSNYSAKAIDEIYNVKPRVIYPPVDVKDFSKIPIGTREPFFVTVGRFERGKRLDLSVKLSAMTGVKGVIIGSFEGGGYLNELIKLRKSLNAPVEFFPNLPRESMVEVMKRASVYFHPTPGEHFGIPIVEAMAAGLITIVPRESGGAEILPEFTYGNLEEASTLLKNNLYPPEELRKSLREKSLSFDKEIFKRKMWDLIESLK